MRQIVKYCWFTQKLQQSKKQSEISNLKKNRGWLTCVELDEFGGDPAAAVAGVKPNCDMVAVIQELSKVSVCTITTRDDVRHNKSRPESATCCKHITRKTTQGGRKSLGPRAPIAGCRRRVSRLPRSVTACCPYSTRCVCLEGSVWLASWSQPLPHPHT